MCMYQLVAVRLPGFIAHVLVIVQVCVVRGKLWLISDGLVARGDTAAGRVANIRDSARTIWNEITKLPSHQYWETQSLTFGAVEGSICGGGIVVDQTSYVSHST